MYFVIISATCFALATKQTQFWFGWYRRGLCEMKSRIDALGSRMAPLFALRFNESVICGCCERCPKTSHRPPKAGQQGRLLCAMVECVRACTCAFMFEYCVWVVVGFMHYGANLFRVTQSWQSNNNSAIPCWENEPW